MCLPFLPIVAIWVKRGCYFQVFLNLTVGVQYVLMVFIVVLKK